MTPEIENPAASDPAITALEKNLWALWSRFGRGEGCSLHQTEDALWFDTPIPTLPYNGVLRFQVSEDVGRRIDAIFDHYRNRNVPFFWLVHPTAEPSDLGRRLEARDLQEIEVCPGMTMNLSSLPQPQVPPEGVEIREVTGEDEVRAILELVAWRWEVPPDVAGKLPGVSRAFNVGTPRAEVRCWMAWREGIPVAKVILNLAAGAAGLYGVATKPEARGMGLARTLTLDAFTAAREEGYDLGVLHSSPMALRLYEKIGFRSRAPFRIFAPPNSMHL